MSETGPDGRRRWPRGWRRGAGTLRGKLIAGLVALLAVACAAVAVVTYLTVHGALTGQVDKQLREASARFSHCEERGPQGEGGAAEGAPGGGPGGGGGGGPAPCVPGDIVGL